jgi:hypothetical protein
MALTAARQRSIVAPGDVFARRPSSPFASLESPRSLGKFLNHFRTRSPFAFIDMFTIAMLNMLIKRSELRAAKALMNFAQLL